MRDIKDVVIDNLIDIILDYDNNHKYYSRNEILRLALMNRTDLRRHNEKLIL